MANRSITVAAIQTSYDDDLADNIAKTEASCARRRRPGAQVILPSELFQGPYFCVAQGGAALVRHRPSVAGEHPCVTALAPLAAELGRGPADLFLRAQGPHSSTAWRLPMLTARSRSSTARAISPTVRAIRRNSTSARATPASKRGTPAGTIGVGICWDQWYPEAARAMALKGAEILFYPTAIGSEPHDLSLDTHARWQRAMQGHAVSNAVPVVAANRIGVEQNDVATQSYYGHPSSPTMPVSWWRASATSRMAC